MFWYGRVWDMKPGSHYLSFFRHFLHGGSLAIVMEDCELGRDHCDMRLENSGSSACFLCVFV